MPLGGNLDPARHTPPLRETVAATTGAGVLRLEDGMPAPGTSILKSSRRTFRATLILNVVSASPCFTNTASRFSVVATC